jgi:hypothetical protein
MRVKQRVSNHKRADEWKHRLSSFFFQAGKLNIAKISQVKPLIYKVETTDREKFIVKGDANEHTLFKQWQFFDEWKGTCLIPFLPFPNGKKMVTGLNYTWVIAPYVKGRKLDYGNTADRKKAIIILRLFHNEATNIFTRYTSEKDTLFERWQKRVTTFAENEYLFHYFGFGTLFYELLQLSKSQLNEVSSFPWKKWEEDAKRFGKWTHGDVASHNFIATDRRTYLIDFDLMKSTNQLYDYIQLGQRFLPYMNWNMESLIHARIVPQMYTAAWLSAVAVPVDMIREWNYFAAKDPPYSQVSRYLSKMQQNWERRKQFINQVRLKV